MLCHKITGMSIDQWEKHIRTRRERALRSGKLHGLPISAYQRNEWIDLYDLSPEHFELVCINRDGGYDTNTFVKAENRARQSLGDTARPGEALPVPNVEDVSDHWWAHYDRNQKSQTPRCTSILGYRFRGLTNPNT